MVLDKIFRSLERVIHGMSWLANGIGAFVLACMMFLIMTDVLLRYLFNRPVSGGFELVEFMMALTISLGMAFTGVKKGHVSVELIVSKFSERVQAAFDVFHFLVATALFFFMSWKTAQQALVVGKRYVTTSVLEIPVYPFMWVLSFCAGLLGLVFFLQFIHSLYQVAKR